MIMIVSTTVTIARAIVIMAMPVVVAVMPMPAPVVPVVAVTVARGIAATVVVAAFRHGAIAIAGLFPIPVIAHRNLPAHIEPRRLGQASGAHGVLANGYGGPEI
jgi:hypothetical protein